MDPTKWRPMKFFPLNSKITSWRVKMQIRPVHISYNEDVSFTFIYARTHWRAFYEPHYFILHINTRFSKCAAFQYLCHHRHPCAISSLASAMCNASTYTRCGDARSKFKLLVFAWCRLLKANMFGYVVFILFFFIFGKYKTREICFALLRCCSCCCVYARDHLRGTSGICAMGEWWWWTSTFGRAKIRVEKLICHITFGITMKVTLDPH